MYVIRVGRRYVDSIRSNRVHYTHKRESALSFHEKADAIHFCIMYFDLLPDYEVEAL